MMMYVWAAIAIAVLFLVWQIIRWWNLPATIEARAKAAAARSERWNNRPGLFGRRQPRGVVPPVVAPPPPKEELKPTPDTAEAIRRINELPGTLPRSGLRGRVRARRNKDVKNG